MLEAFSFMKIEDQLEIVNGDLTDTRVVTMVLCCFDDFLPHANTTVITAIIKAQTIF